MNRYHLLIFFQVLASTNIWCFIFQWWDQLNALSCSMPITSNTTPLKCQGARRTSCTKPFKQQSKAAKSDRWMRLQSHPHFDTEGTWAADPHNTLSAQFWKAEIVPIDEYTAATKVEVILAQIERNDGDKYLWFNQYLGMLVERLVDSKNDPFIEKGEGEREKGDESQLQHNLL